MENPKDTKAETAAEWLQRAYEERRARRHRFSRRALARMLKIRPGRLSEMMSGKRPVGQVLAQRVATQLNLSAPEMQAWLDAVERTRKLWVAKRGLKRLGKIDAGGDSILPASVKIPSEKKEMVQRLLLNFQKNLVAILESEETESESAFRLSFALDPVEPIENEKKAD